MSERFVGNLHLQQGSECHAAASASSLVYNGSRYRYAYTGESGSCALLQTCRRGIQRRLGSDRRWRTLASQAHAHAHDAGAGSGSGSGSGGQASGSSEGCERWAQRHPPQCAWPWAAASGRKAATERGAVTNEMRARVN
ncbi:hypothetical protein K458DRAFT_127713 [Lentithecium fluviatile CBS 122367]|uniref:Uncharacterized protein n=1 Tax=Lentithecium fluviatile CBS 122367 TaxID=1168545 RepID=A0A6G1JGS6_9PLEO|nr:hypothetical protein K458DRAFT_127713 [Lentithecium fluviatile CBS 122367]